MAKQKNADFYEETWKGTSGNDKLVKYGVSNARFDGGAGNDNISINGARNVKIYGGAGNDTLSVDWENQTKNVLLDGGAGNDKIDVDGSNSTVLGGDGNDFISVKGNNWSVNGGAGNDTIQLWGWDKDVTVTGGVGKDTFRLMGPREESGKWVTITDLSSEDVLRFEMNPEYKNAKYMPDTHKTNPYYKKDGSISYLTAKRSGSTVTLTGNAYGVNLTLKNVTDLNKIANVKVVNGSKTTTLRKLIKPSKLPAGITEKKNQLVVSNSFKKTFDLGNYVSWSKDINAAANRQKITIKGDGRGNTIMAGSAGNVICGMGGNDTIKCGKGADKIQFYKGDGKDTIQGAAKNDILYLYNITNIKTQAKFKMSGKNLVMSFNNNKNDSITITNWSTGGLNKFVVGGKTYSLKKSANTVSVK